MMSSLSQILAAHGSLLVLDATGTAQAAYWPAKDAGPRTARVEGEMGRALFRAVQQVCPQIAEAGAFAFAESPGSILGIRTAATALRVWTALQPRPVFAFHALALAATREGPERAWIADARRGMWHLLIPGQAARRVAREELKSAAGELPLATLAGYRHWDALPPNTTTESHELGVLLGAAADVDLFELRPAPDAALSAEPSYVQWTPRIHQLP